MSEDKPRQDASADDATAQPATETGVIAVSSDGTATAATGSTESGNAVEVLEDTAATAAEPAPISGMPTAAPGAGDALADQAADTSPTHSSAAAAAPSATGNAMPETNSVSSSPAPVAPVVIKQSSGKGVALGALVLSLLALGASGFLFVQGQNVLKTQELSFDQKISQAGVGQGKNAALLEGNVVKLQTVDQQLQAVQSQMKQQGAQLESAQKAYQELVKSRADWLVDETEATLNLAAQQLLISGNVPVAVGVLESLESRLTRFDQPLLLPIKQAISSDLNTLKNTPYLDVASASLRLNRLETAITNLPLSADSALQPGAEKPLVAADPNAPWWQRAWQSTVNSLKGMVEVRHLNNNDSMLMSPEQVFFVRENLRLRVMDARLALMQRSGEVYAGDLNSAEAVVKQYFDAQSPATSAWLQELAQLKALDVQNGQDSNVLAASLAAVRQYQQQAQTDALPALPALTASAPVAAASAAETAAASVPVTPVPASDTQGGRAL